MTQLQTCLLPVVHLNLCPPWGVYLPRRSCKGHPNLLSCKCGEPSEVLIPLIISYTIGIDRTHLPTFFKWRIRRQDWRPLAHRVTRRRYDQRQGPIISPQSNAMLTRPMTLQAPETWKMSAIFTAHDPLDTSNLIWISLSTSIHAHRGLCR